jgi:phosphorylcholine metabolism protein LicD
MNSDTENDLSQLRITPQDVVDFTSECVHNVLTKNNINYTIFSGTALGAERHGGLIPWDDTDTAILSKDEPGLVALAETFAKQGYILREEPLQGYRLYHATVVRPRALDQHPYCYSFQRNIIY